MGACGCVSLGRAHVCEMVRLAAADAMAGMLKSMIEDCAALTWAAAIATVAEVFVLDAGCLQLCVHIGVVGVICTMVVECCAAAACQCIGPVRP